MTDFCSVGFKGLYTAVDRPTSINNSTFKASIYNLTTIYWFYRLY